MSKLHTYKGRVILHIDMNCFFAAVEMAYHPELKGKPLAIAGDPNARKGIVITSSYEARAKGVKTTMPLWEAKKLCRDLIVRTPNFDRYRKASKEIFQILARISPLIEPVSIDEGYLDITEASRLEHSVDIAKNLQKRIYQELDLPCSIGIAPNKFLAKMASDMKKPLGITILRKRDLPERLWPLSVTEMHGVGKKTAEKLASIDVKTIRDLAYSDVYQLKILLGINGERLKNRANGIDPRVVDPDAINDFKSIGSSQTLPYDTTNEGEIFPLIDRLADNVEKRLARKLVAGCTIQLMIRYDDRKTITRSRKLAIYIHQKADIARFANQLWRENWDGKPIRLLGVTIQDLLERQNIGEQLDLFTYEKKEQKDKLNQVIKGLSEKYGKNPFQQKEEASIAAQQTTSFQKDFLDDYRKE